MEEMLRRVRSFVSRSGHEDEDLPDEEEEGEDEEVVEKFSSRLADLVWEMVCTLRVGRRWMQDHSLEKTEFTSLWMPFKGFMLHVLLLICLNTTCVLRLYKFMYVTHDHVEDFFAHSFFASSEPTGQLFTFWEIDNHKRLWDYLTNVLPNIMDEDPPSVPGGNILLGFARLRQVRVRATPCHVSVWGVVSEHYRQCWDFFSLYLEDRAPFGSGEAWSFRQNPEGSAPSGYMGTYPADGYWLDVPRNKAAALRSLEELRDKNWTDRATRAVFLDMSVLNENLNMLCVLRLKFETPPGAGVLPDHVFSCFPFNQHAEVSDHQRLAFELLSIFSAVALTWNELHQLIAASGGMWEHVRGRYTSPWHLMQLGMTACLWEATWLSMQRYDQTSRLMLGMQLRGAASPLRADLLNYYQVTAIAYLTVATFLAWMLTFRYHRVTAQVLVTLKRSRYDLTSYFVMYVLLHSAFAQAGYYLLGDQVGLFKTFSDSSLAILAISLGDIDVDEILVAHWIIGPIFFCILIFVVVFVFHNLFFVILSYNYDAVRQERSHLSRGLPFSAFLQNGLLNVRQALRLPTARATPHQELQLILQRCGFSPGSIQAFNTAYLSGPAKVKMDVRDEDRGASRGDLMPLDEKVQQMEEDLDQAKNELSSLVKHLSRNEPLRLRPLRSMKVWEYRNRKEDSLAVK